MARTTVTLNQGVDGATVAFWLDASSAFHQYVIMETQSGSGDPSPIGTSNPLPVIFNAAQPIVGDLVAGNQDNNSAGVKLSAVYNSSPPTYASGQRSNLQTDNQGNLLVNIAAGQNAGGTSSTYGAAFPAAGTAIGFLNNAGTGMQAGQLDGSGNLKVNIVAGSVQAVTDNSSNLVSGTTQALATAYAFNDSASAVTSGNMGIPHITANRQQRCVIDASANGGATAYSAISSAAA